MKPQRDRGSVAPEARGATNLRLGVSGIRLTGSHGVDPRERERGNRFEVDVECVCRNVDAVETDELADTVDYRAITDLVRETSSRHAFNLIESLAGAIAAALLKTFPMISETVVRVSKLAPPGLSDVDRTKAEVTRRRG